MGREVHAVGSSCNSGDRRLRSWICQDGSGQRLGGRMTPCRGCRCWDGDRPFLGGRRTLCDGQVEDCSNIGGGA